MKKEQYQEYVKLGKDLISKIENHQIKICEYAFAVCDIKHGGKSDHLYTIANYANDIGIVPKTLRNWLSVYRNVIAKIDDYPETNEAWKVARRVDNKLTLEAKQYGIEITNKKNYKNDFPKAFVQKVFDSEINEKPFKAEYRTMLQNVKHCKFLVEKRDLNILEYCELLELMETLDAASDKINDFLTKKQRGAA